MLTTPYGVTEGPGRPLAALADLAAVKAEADTQTDLPAQVPAPPPAPIAGAPRARTSSAPSPASSPPPSVAPLRPSPSAPSAVSGPSAPSTSSTPEEIASPRTAEAAMSAGHPGRPEGLDGSDLVDSFNSTDDPPGVAGPEAPRRRRRWLPWAAASLLLGAVGIGGYAYASHYAQAAVPGTTIAGQDVAGLSRQEIVDLVQSRADAATVSISGDVSSTATLADLGTNVDAQATADAAMAHSAGIIDRFAALIRSNPVAVVSTSDSHTAAAYTDALIPADQAKATNATVVLADDGTTFTTTSAAEGLSLDAAAVTSAAEQAAAELSSQSLTLSYTAQAPAVSDAQAQQIADEANAWAAQDVTVTTASGQSFTADAKTKAAWVVVSSTEDAAPTLSVDSEKVSAWVTEQASSINKDAVTGSRLVNSQGEVLATKTEAKNGIEVSNTEDVAVQIASAVGSGQSYTGSFETATIEATWNDKVIADGAQNLIYPAAPGEKWVDVNLSSKTVTAYEGATVVRGPMLITDGATETPTVTGTYQVYLKYQMQTMRGQNADGTPYETKDVPWVTYWYSGYAFHGAPWLSAFGGSSSHGCVNMPVSEAEWMYNWSEIGTTVVSHH